MSRYYQSPLPSKMILLSLPTFKLSLTVTTPCSNHPIHLHPNERQTTVSIFFPKLHPSMSAPIGTPISRSRKLNNKLK